MNKLLNWLRNIFKCNICQIRKMSEDKSFCDKKNGTNDYHSLVDASEDYFEKNLIYLSGGGLTISMLFIEKIVPIATATCLCLLILGWISLALALILNLISHRVSVYQTQCCEDDELIKKLEYEKRVENAKKRRTVMRWINNINIALLTLGIFFVVLFVSINTVNHNNLMAKKDERKTPLTEGKDIRIPPPPPQQQTEPQKPKEIKENKK